MEYVTLTEAFASMALVLGSTIGSMVAYQQFMKLRNRDASSSRGGGMPVDYQSNTDPKEQLIVLQEAYISLQRDNQNLKVTLNRLKKEGQNKDQIHIDLQKELTALRDLNSSQSHKLNSLKTRLLGLAIKTSGEQIPAQPRL